MYMLKPEHLKQAMQAHGVEPAEMHVPELAIFTFNRAIIKELTGLCNLSEWQWQGGQFTPYASPMKTWIGNFKEIDIAVLLPPMGASPIAALTEELIYFGVKTILLLCASWSVGKDYLKRGQIHLPDQALGQDGTSIYYGNVDKQVKAEPRAYKALEKALGDLDAEWKTGPVGSCEAIYRITKNALDEYRSQGCLSLENGEVAVLYSIARELNLTIGVLLQPYIDLEQGWQLSYMDESYEQTCKIQARAALEAGHLLTADL